MQGGPAVGWVEGGVGRQALLFPSYDPRARGGAGARAQSDGPLSGGSALDDPAALAQDLAELLETLLHLGDAGQLLLKPLLLLSQA